MVVATIVCTLVLLGFITMAVRWLDGQETERHSLLNVRLDVIDGFRRNDRDTLSRIETLGGSARKDITDLWGLVAEEHASLRGAITLGLAASEEQLQQRLDRTQVAAVEAAEALRTTLERQLADIMREVSDPAVVILLRALAEAFQIPLALPAAPMESPAVPTVGGPLAPHPVPNIGRQLEVARFSEETITAGMQDLIDGAAARGVTLHPSEARHQTMLMLNGVDIE